MSQKKLKRFGEIKSFSNVLEYPESMAGNWNVYLKNQNPISIELACGKGEYTTGLARLYQQKNFIGVDIKGNRIWVGAKFAMDHALKNVAFLRTQIEEIDSYFSKNEVDEIWITFPDPQLRISKAKKRLTHPRFLRLYHKFIKQGGKIHLKTDSPDLYDFTKIVIELYNLEIISDLVDIHNINHHYPELKIITHYESLDIAESNKIFYLCFSLPEKLIDNDKALDDILKQKTNG